MATQTPNLGLKKPAGTDYVRINDFNENADTLDGKIGKLSSLETDEKTNLVLAINEARRTGGTNAPYIGENGNWWQWDYTTSQFIDTGVPAEGLDGNDGADGTSAYVWIKWSLIPPTQDSDMQGTPADYIGIYAGMSSTPPTAYTSYTWYKYKGDAGGIGPAGPANTLSIGTVQNGDEADATITGASPNQTLNLTLPQGDTGDTGAPGAAATIAVGTTVTGAPGTDASVVNEGTSSAAVFKFTIPRGANGADGEDGREVELRKTTTHIQWRYTDETWANLVALTDIKGDTGAKGDTGGKGDTGAKGDTGNGIASVALISGNHAPGTQDTYRITFTDSTTYDFYVYNGADGTGAGDMLKATYDPTNKNSDAFLLSNMTGDATHRTVTDTEKSTWNGKLGASGDGSGVTAAFTAAGTRANITTGETLATLFGKLAKWFADFGTLAWKSIIVTADITDANVTSAKLANMAAYTVKGRNASSSGVPSDVTMLDVAEYALYQGTTATSVADTEFVSIPVSATSLKKITWANVKAALETYFDTLYASVSSILPLGETSSTAYRGDRGKTAYDHSQASGNPHGTTASDVGAAASTHKANHATGGSDALTAADIGAEASGTASSAVSTHNSSGSAHDTRFAAKLDNVIGIVTVSANLTLSDSHCGKHLWCTNSSAITITIPTGLGAGFNCTLDRWGAGDVTLTPSGVTINGGSTSVTLGDRYDAAVSIVAGQSNVFSAKGGIA